MQVNNNYQNVVIFVYIVIRSHRTIFVVKIVYNYTTKCLKNTKRI